MPIERIDFNRLKVPTIIRMPAIHSKLKAVKPIGEEPDRKKDEKGHLQWLAGGAERRSRFLLEQIEKGLLEGVSGTLEKQVVDNHDVFVGMVSEGPKEERGQFPVVFMEFLHAPGLFEIHVPIIPKGHAGPVEWGKLDWNNFVITKEAISKLFGVDLKA